MGKLFTTGLVALGLLGLSACARSDEPAADNAVDAGSDAGAAIVDGGAPANDVTVVDGDGAVANAAEPALPADDGNAALTGNAAEPLGNGS